MYSSKKIEHAELVLTAPDSFRVKTLRTKDTMRNLIENTEKSLTITGYSISDYFAEMLDVIIKKSQQGVYVRIYVNDIELLIPEKQGTETDLENCTRIYNAMKNLNIQTATEERVWAYLTHNVFWDYMRKRWPVEDETIKRVL